jgi:hypothetical protein
MTERRFPPPWSVEDLVPSIPRNALAKLYSEPLTSMTTARPMSAWLLYLIRSFGLSGRSPTAYR